MLHEHGRLVIIPSSSVSNWHPNLARQHTRKHIYESLSERLMSFYVCLGLSGASRRSQAQRRGVLHVCRYAYAGLCPRDMSACPIGWANTEVSLYSSFDFYYRFRCTSSLRPACANPAMVTTGCALEPTSRKWQRPRRNSGAGNVVRVGLVCLRALKVSAGAHRTVSHRVALAFSRMGKRRSH